MNEKDSKRLLLEKIIVKNDINSEDEEKIFEIIPILQNERNFEQKNPWHIYDVWNHTKAVMNNSKKEIKIRLVLLLHDIGKPFSYQDDENGIRHFKGHAEKSSKIAYEILKKLDYSDEDVKEICWLISKHSSNINKSDINEKNLPIIKKLLYIQYCDASGYNPEYIPQVYKKLDELTDFIKDYETKIKQSNEKI